MMHSLQNQRSGADDKGENSFESRHPRSPTPEAYETGHTGITFCWLHVDSAHVVAYIIKLLTDSLHTVLFLFDLSKA